MPDAGYQLLDYSMIEGLSVNIIQHRASNNSIPNKKNNPEPKPGIVKPKPYYLPLN